MSSTSLSDFAARQIKARVLKHPPQEQSIMDLANMIGAAIDSPSQKNVSEKIQKAEEYKLIGNEAYKKGDLKEALRNYHIATIHVKGLMQTSADEKQRIAALTLSCRSNMAAVYIKLEEWEKAINTCTEIIKTDANNVKALFRRGKAQLARRNLDKASLDLNAALKLAPTDSEIIAELNRLKLRFKEAEQREKEVYRSVMKGMFGGEDSQ